MSIRKKILIPSSGVLVLLLIAGFFLFRRAEVTVPPGARAKTEALSKMSEKKTASPIPPVRVSSNAQREGRASQEIKPEEIKKEVAPPESEKMVLPDRPREAPSWKAGKEADRKLDEKKETPRKVFPESKVPVRAEKEAPKTIKKEIPQERTRIVSAPLPPPAKKESRSREELVPQTVIESKAPAIKESPKEAPKEDPKQVVRVSKELPKEVPNEALKEASKEVSTEVAKEVSKEPPKEAPKEVLKEAPKEGSKEVPKEIPKQIAREVPKQSARVTLHPGEKLTVLTKEERGVASRPSLFAKEEEVGEFFSNYVGRYNRKDIGGFLSLFSSKAVHNQKDGIEGIRGIYTRFFDESRALRFQLEGMKTEIYQNRAEVQARFRVDQTLKKASQEKIWKGNIRWVLAKEEGRLKIISLDYQNDKSP